MNLLQPGKLNCACFLIFLFLFFPGINYAAGQWSISGGAEYYHGKYIYDTPTTTYNFYGSLRYQTRRWNASLTVPVISQNNNLVSSGGMFFPGQSSASGGMGGGSMGGSRRGGGMMPGYTPTVTTQSQYQTGLGDIYVNGRYTLWSERPALPALAVSGQIKFPTANPDKNFGSGKFDFGYSLNFSKRIRRTALFADVGYLALGDPTGIEYMNPFTYGLGLGYFWGSGKMSGLIYYQGYSKILEGYDAPRQAALGFYFHTTPKTTLSFTVTKGFSNTSPDFAAGIGISHNL